MDRSFRTVCLWALTLCVIASQSARAREPDPKRLQVFILAGQSNMVGHANYITLPRLIADERPEVQKLAALVFKDGMTVTRNSVDEQIATRIERDGINTALRKKEIQGEPAIAEAQARLQQIQEKYDQQTQAIRSAFAVSDRVYINSIADRNRRWGPLTIGFGASADKIGPELGFGMSLAGKLNAPILLIKTSWGGKSLHYNFRPPSAGPYVLNEKEQASEKAEQVARDAGLNYRLMTEQVNQVLGDLNAHHPAYDPQAGHDLAGFVWFQGFNDQFAPEFRDNYRDNMVTFIKDVRNEFAAPDMTFVIGVLGTGITAEKVGENPVSVAQREAAMVPEFKDNVISVESYKVYDLSALKVFEKGWQNHFAEWCAVGSDRPYHYLGSGKFFVRFGDALATSMADLIQKQ